MKERKESIVKEDFKTGQAMYSWLSGTVGEEWAGTTVNKRFSSNNSSNIKKKISEFEKETGSDKKVVGHVGKLLERFQESAKNNKKEMIVKDRKDKMSEKERQWKEKVVRMKCEKGDTEKEGAGISTILKTKGK